MAPKGNKNAVGNKGGVGGPELWRPEFCEIARNCAAELKATNRNLATILGVALSTIESWITDKSEFSRALEEGKEIADSKVEIKLVERAMGYTGKNQKVLADGQIVEYEESYPPDPTCLKFWLTNRQRAKWRDKQDVEVTGKDGEALIPAVNVSIKSSRS